MPGLSTRVLKPGTVSADQKRKNSKQKQKRLLKTIRIIYSDPDLTDSSSDDEQGTRKDKQYTNHGVKRCAKVVQMFEDILHVKKKFKVPSQSVLNQKGLKSTSKYVGVKQRKTGKWVAEIRDSLGGVRHWLGTYNTEEEAYSAYERKILELEALFIEQKRVKASTPTCKVAQSPSSVLEVSNTSSHGSGMSAIDKVKQDCNEKLAKEEKLDIEDEMKLDLQEQLEGLFSNSALEGNFKLVFDELKQEDFMMCNLGDLADLPNSSSLLNLGMEDFSWLDEVLKYCGFED